MEKLKNVENKSADFGDSFIQFFQTDNESPSKATHANPDKFTDKSSENIREPSVTIQSDIKGRHFIFLK